MIGGLDVYIRNSIEYNNGDFDFVIVHGVDDKNNPIIKNNMTIKEYKVALYRKLNPIIDLKCLLQVIKIVRQEKPNIIHCHSAKGGVIGRIAGWITNTKTLYTPHAFSFLSANSKLKKYIYLLFERCVKFNSYLLACSNSEKQLGLDVVHYSKNRALVWNNAVPDTLKYMKNGK